MEHAADPHPILHIAIAVDIGAADDPCPLTETRGKVSADSVGENNVPLVAPVLLLVAPDPLLVFMAEDDEDTLMMSSPGLTKIGEKIML